MTLLWKKEQVPLILNGKKTVTRRFKKPFVKEGETYLIRIGYSKYLDKKIYIKRIYTQFLCEITEEDAIKEGLSSLNEYKKVWTKIYGEWEDTKKIWVIEFNLV
ncbi:ASCH domain-containing protein [Candidatus Bathyarchaeota archaeon]|nr:ASCH domain-containing protein [Candidatus Bathyarchaeota archaeon]